MDLLVLAMTLVLVTGPNGQHLEVNPNQVVALRVPQSDSHFPPSVKCLILTADGKFIGVVETCEEISVRLTKAKGD